MTENTMEPIEYMCGECGKVVLVRPYTEDEYTLLAGWVEHQDEDPTCRECAEKLFPGEEEDQEH